VGHNSTAEVKPSGTKKEGGPHWSVAAFRGKTQGGKRERSERVTGVDFPSEIQNPGEGGENQEWKFVEKLSKGSRTSDFYRDTETKAG